MVHGILSPSLSLIKLKKYHFSDRCQLLNKVTRDFIIVPCIDGTPVDCAQDLLLRRGPLATTSSQSFMETLKLKRKVFVLSKVQYTFTM